MIIGIVGFMSSGKGTVGDMLERRYGFKTESFAKPLKDAAAAIFGWDRQMLEGASTASREWREKEDPYWSEVLGRPGFTPRLALQLLGTESGRQVFGENLWIASCMKRCGVGQLQYPVTHYVVTDARFRNEVEAIRDAGGIVIRVKRGPEPEWATAAMDAAMHTAETYPLEVRMKRCGITEEEAREEIYYERLCSYMRDYNLVTEPQIHQSEWDWLGLEFDYVINNDGSFTDLERQVYDILFDLRVYHGAFVSTEEMGNLT